MCVYCIVIVSYPSTLRHHISLNKFGKRRAPKTDEPWLSKNLKNHGYGIDIYQRAWNWNLANNTNFLFSNETTPAPLNIPTILDVLPFSIKTSIFMFFSAAHLTHSLFHPTEWLSTKISPANWFLFPGSLQTSLDGESTLCDGCFVWEIMVAHCRYDGLLTDNLKSHSYYVKTKLRNLVSEYYHKTNLLHMVNQLCAMAVLCGKSR